MFFRDAIAGSPQSVAPSQISSQHAMQPFARVVRDYDGVILRIDGVMKIWMV
jgi:hypothetical protein